MGTDIHIVVQVREAGSWREGDVPTGLDERRYNIFSFLTGAQIRGYGHPALLPEPRGWPDDFVGPGWGPRAPTHELEGVGHSKHWLLLKELTAVDYLQTIEVKSVRSFSEEYNEKFGRWETQSETQIDRVPLHQWLGGDFWIGVISGLLIQVPPLGSEADVRLVFGFDS